MIKVNLWYIYLMYIFQLLNLLFFFIKPTFQRNPWLIMTLNVGAHIAILGLLVNIYFMIVCVIDGSVDQYVKLVAYLYEAATVTGPVAIWGATVIWLMCDAEKNNNTQILYISADQYQALTQQNVMHPRVATPINVMA